MVLHYGVGDMNFASKNTLLNTWIVLNASWIAFMAFAYTKGWITTIIMSDPSFITHTILAVTGIGLVIAAGKTLSLNRMCKQISTGRQQYLQKLAQYGELSRPDIKEALKLRLTGRLAILRYIATILFTMGIIGTFVGLIMGTHSITPEIVSSATSAQTAVALMISGMGVALFTTLTGAVTGVWIGMNVYILTQAARDYYTGVLDYEG